MLEKKIILNGETIRFLRTSAGLSRENLAELVDVTSKTIQNIETKKDHGVRPSTWHNLGEKLGKEPSLLLLPLEKILNVSPISSGPPIDFDLVCVLVDRHRHKLTDAISRGDKEAASDEKSVIKRYCVDIESYLTMKAAEADEICLYSDSSMIDAGIVEYEKDRCWQSLIYDAGKSARYYNKVLARTLFVNPGPITLKESEALFQVVIKHLNCNHSVSFVDDKSVKGDLRPKRNIGLMGKFGMVAATDQIQWDLDVDNSRNRLLNAREQHHAFSKEPLTVFHPKDEEDPKRIRVKLKEFFPILEEQN